MSEENKTGELVVAEATTTPSIANQFDIVDVESAKAFMDNYQELVEALLDDSDYQVINGKKAKKKSAWRKLATAFNISDDIIHSEETRDENGQIVSAKFFVEAKLPNGRTSVAVGECSIYDKIRYNGKNIDKTQPSNFELRGRFSNVEHDVPATAHTRAKSRAIADLIGSGENSAEELEGLKSHNGRSRATPVEQNTSKSKPKEAKPIETTAEVVDAEVVKEEPKPKRAGTIKELMDSNKHINKAVHELQSQDTSVSRATISEKLMDFWDMGKITKDEYDEAQELIQN